MIENLEGKVGGIRLRDILGGWKNGAKKRYYKICTGKSIIKSIH